MCTLPPAPSDSLPPYTCPSHPSASPQWGTEHSAILPPISGIHYNLDSETLIYSPIQIPTENTLFFSIDNTHYTYTYTHSFHPSFSPTCKHKTQSVFTKPLTFPLKPNYCLKTVLKIKHCCWIRPQVNQKKHLNMIYMQIIYTDYKDVGINFIVHNRAKSFPKTPKAAVDKNKPPF